MNVFRTGILMAAMTAIFLGVGYLIGGTGGMGIAFVVAAAMNFFAYWNSDRMVLSMHHAREVDDRSAPELVALVRNLATSAGLPMPKVYIIDNPQPNAFATGRNPQNAAVAATTGLLSRLSRDEIEGVMAHELAHVEHRDTLTMTLTATLAGAISMLANFAFFFGGRDRNNPLGLIGTLAIMILAPIAAMLVQMAISRTREYAADKRGAEICGRPMSLANALRKLHQGAASIPNPDAEGAPATAHLFIVNPLRSGGVDDLFATHPRMEERIRRLEAMATGGASAHAYHTTSASPRRRATGSSGIPESDDKRPKSPWG